MRSMPPWPLAAVVPLLFLGVLYEFFAPQAAYSVPEVHVAALPVLPKQSTMFLAPPPNEFAVISERPLFDSQRKKYVAPPVDAADRSAPPPPPNLSLVGVIIDADRKLAMVKSSEGALASSVGIGTEISGWQVATIEPDRIVLKAGNSEQEVRLDANKAPSQPAQSPVAAGTRAAQTQALQAAVQTKSTP